MCSKVAKYVIQMVMCAVEIVKRRVKTGHKLGKEGTMYRYNSKICSLNSNFCSRRIQICS